MLQRYELRLPDLGFATAGFADVPLSLCAWFAEVGDRVTEGESLAEVLAGEASIELSAPASGYLVERCASTGESLAAGQLLAIIESRSNIRGQSGPAVR
jgi:pyruvate/2-oxoglutarate dehydrogenase complex dihydrolipoamide acyltransferase (E2) component